MTVLETSEGEEGTQFKPGRPLPAWFARALFGYGVAIALFHVWFNTFGDLPGLYFNALHLGFIGSFGFLASRGPRGFGAKTGLAIDGLLSLVVLGGGIYLVTGLDLLHARGEVMIAADVIAGALTLTAALLLCQRTSGWIVPVLVLLAIGYVTFLGRHLDGIFHFKGLPAPRILYRFFFTSEGLFGVVADISSTYVFMFVLFAAFLLKSGAGDFIVRLSQVFAGRLAGGPGYIAVASSALMGTISGSAVANVASTGVLTIPMMKRAGFRPEFAAGVEAAASTGGQIMPPIMGAGAFIMAQWTGLPYSHIVAVSLLPALLFYGSVGFSVYFHARKLGLKPVPSATREPLGPLLREGATFLVPVGALVGLLASGFTPTYAAGLGLIAVVVASRFHPHHRMGFREIADACALGTQNMVQTAALLVCTGVVIGALNLTGLSISFSQMVVEWADGSLGLAFVLIALVSLVLGMGLPTTAAYVMLAIVAVPALERMGVPELSAHLIIFWFAQSSNVTPPICLAAFTAAAIAQTPPMRTGIAATQISKGFYVVPLLFAFNRLATGSPVEMLIIAAFALAGLFAFTAATARHLAHPLGLVASAWLLPVAGALFAPSLALNLAGLAALAGTLIWSQQVARRQT
jgi:TRAP transporter 4TM/12TM fusion protein